MTTSTAGRIANAFPPIVCPSWCVTDHSEDPWPNPEDVFHRSEPVDVPAPPGARPQYAEPLVQTHLVEHSTNAEYACIAIGTPDRGFDMDTVAQVDAYLTHLKTYTAAVEEMRARLAAIKEQS